MYQLKQIRFQKEDRASFLIPRLEKEIRKEVHQIKQENDNIIKLGCYIQFFSLNIILILSDYYFQSKQPSNTTKILFLGSQELLQVFTFYLSGFFIDIISIRSSWLFLIITNVIFQVFHLVSFITQSIQISFIAKLSSQLLFFMCIINFSCILYETAPTFKNRLNNAIKLEVFGVYFPYIISDLLECILKDYVQLKEEYVQQILKDILICGVIFCQLLNLISLLILNKTYKQIEKIKVKSLQYQRFKIYQGVGLSLSKIFKYMQNKNIYFLLVISAVCGCQNDSYYYLASDVFSSNTQDLIVNILGLLGGLFIMSYVNSSKNLVQLCYNTITYCFYAYIIINVLQVTIRITPLELYQSKVLIILETLLLIIKESLFFIIYSLTHQLVIILLPKRCAMRAIGLSMIFFPYSIFQITCILSEINILWMRIAQIIITIVAIIINYLYQRNISFDIIEKQLAKQYNY